MPATQADVRRLALAHPGVVEAPDRFAFGVAMGSRRRDLVWAWLERVDPKRARVPSATVVAVRVADLGTKQAVLASDDRVFFTEPQYDGYPAVLVRLSAIAKRALAALIADAYQDAVSHATKPRTPARRRASRS